MALDARRALARRRPDRCADDATLRGRASIRRARASRAWYELFPRSARREPGAHGTFARRRGAAAVRRGDGLRRPLPAADPPDRPTAPQGHEQRARRRARRRRQPVGDRRARRAATRRSIPSSARSRTSDAWSQRRASTASRSRSTSPSSARPTIRTCSEHPEWFRQRPDGTIQYAENPPKKYQDIYPFDFETDDWRGAVGGAARASFEFWIEQGVRIFRVDNPHTKPFAFWEWLIGEVKREHPEVIFLVRGVHAAEGDAPAGQARLHPVVHLLHLAQHQGRS